MFLVAVKYTDVFKQPSCSQQYGVNEAPDGRDLRKNDQSKNPSAKARASIPVDPNKDSQDCLPEWGRRKTARETVSSFTNMSEGGLCLSVY